MSREVTRSHYINSIASSLGKSEQFIIDAQNDRSFTYEEFGLLTQKAAQLLLDNGLKRGDRVGLLLSNSVEFAAMYFGCLMCGVAAVAVNPLLLRTTIEYIVKKSKVTFVVCCQATSDKIKGLIPEVLIQCGVDRAEGLDLDAMVPGTWVPFDGVNDEDIWSITYTSGTASNPKGVVHCARGLIGCAAAFNSMHEFDEKNIFLNIFPMSYMAGFLNCLLAPFVCGGTVVLERPFDARSVLTFWKSVIAHNVNAMWLAPTMVSSLLHVDRDKSGLQYAKERLERVCVGTAPLPMQTKQDFEKKYQINLYESYGLSELLIVAANSPANDNVDSAGKLLDGVRVQIGSGESDLPATEGELAIATEYQMLGYLSEMNGDLDDPEDWFFTGELGMLTQTGFLKITGRSKDLIIKGGLNISPRAIEEVLLSHADVLEAAVIGLPHEFYGEEVVAVLKLANEIQLDTIKNDIRALCHAKLNESSKPARIFQVQAMPLNASGKIQKRELVARFA